MKLFIEFVKIALLLAIAIFLSMSIGLLQNPVLGQNELIESSTKIALTEVKKNDANQRGNDLRKIMENSLAQPFNFPSSVIFQDTEYEYKRVFHDHGINILPEKELEFATLCGQYSASNAMAVYGALSPFYAEVSVNNAEKGITGEVWLEIDGKIKRLISLDSSSTLDGDLQEFKKLYAKNCGDINSSFMGKFSKYDIGFKAFFVKNNLEYLNKLSKYPDSKQSLQHCFDSGASGNYCIIAEACLRIKQLNKNTMESCSFRDKVCSVNDTGAECEEKLKTASETKKSSNK
ncbi:hypothetical protein [Marinobacter sp. LV10R520-4]|uniref:hypothetical protein n=1 Tax=Marinobacter sp. LV10R520-4 TaxID=1761796 RepID=UPI001180872D|nr:hypothetical protein [Marinobacter sp. LV10R520-4]